MSHRTRTRETRDQNTSGLTVPVLFPTPAVMLDLTQGQCMIEHIGAHILYDPEVIRSTGPLCGLCLRLTHLCQFFLGKGKGRNGKVKINQKMSRGCLMKINYSYGVATESMASSPYSNVPIHCPICPKSNPAIWKYFMKMHFEEKHKALLTKHDCLWKPSNFERTEMKKIWVKRGKVTAKRTKKTNQPLLVVSERHRAQIPSTYLNFISDVEGTITYYFLFQRRHRQ
jgi:hypothetical protein